MHALKIATASVLALTVAGCGSSARTSAVATGRLDCPDHQGELTRTGMAADGKTCTYAIGDHGEVTLRLIPVGAGGPEGALAAVEQQLKAEAGPAAAAAIDKAEDSAAKAGARAKAAAEDARRAADEAARDAAKARDVAERAAEPQTWDDKAIEERVNAKLREKGIDVDDSGDDDREETAHVNMPGIHINAHGDSADVRVGPLHIDANGDTATIRSMDSAYMRGEGLTGQRRGIRAMFLYSGDGLAGGYKYVGYEASGPRTGPLAVAIVKERSEGGFHGDIYGSVKKLVRRNGGT